MIKRLITHTTVIVKKIIYPTALVVLLSMATVRSGAQPTAQPQPVSVLEKMSQLYQQWSGITIQFAANIRSDKNSVSESFEGILSMKADKFVLTTPDTKTWFDGATQWTYIPATGEVSITAPTGNDLRFTNPVILLQSYQKDFHVSYLGESTSANARIAYDFALTPRKKDEIERIEIQIEKNSSLPARFVLTMHSGTRNTFYIKEIKEVAHPDETFTFPANEYPEAEIIDLR
jgi:outer membrane lipoprotein-sorting protein